MKVEPSAINRYKIHMWYNRKKREPCWGIDVIIDGHAYHVQQDKPLFFESKSEAIKCVRKLNKELRENKKP